MSSDPGLPRRRPGLDVGLQAADVDGWPGLLGEVLDEAGRVGVLAP
ncbi:hypothetical protein O7635_22480 [Asanoa sp. WMMD1127]|nr:hypothetical protein [Asanoa sp. WMMD1127]MDG4824626.1 hypothetical protein [Asanoa sp. WMMD1127]